MIPTRGTVRSIGAQKLLIPARVMDTALVAPDTITKVMNSRASVGGAVRSWRLPPLKAVESRANLARKPDRGGSPAIISAQQTKLTPRSAIVAGTGTP